ncbi:MAG TPA: PDZ domain-containing protein [Candidatus Binatia bacterium]|nr:PDZ domain-containing protein [Candidatus Binatia bacterium]
MRGALVVVLLALAAVASAVDAAQWAWLGVRIRDLSEQEMDEISSRHGMREGFGVFIVEVMEGTPAETAGLKNGDLVVAFEERPVTETRVLQRLIASSGPGRDVRLTVLRAEGRRRLDVRLAAMPRPVLGERIGAEFGFVVREAEPGGSTVLAISVVVRKSSAERAGLEAGDVILQVNDQEVATREALREALADASLEMALRLTVRRGGSRLPLVLKAPGS